MKCICQNLKDFKMKTKVQILFMVAILMSLSSCSTKKKLTERTKEQVKISTETTGVKITDENTAVKITNKNDIASILITENTETILTQAENKDQVIEVSDNKGNTLKIKGANARFAKKKQVEKQQDQTKQAIKITEEKLSEVQNEASEEIDTLKKSSNIDLEKQGLNTGVSLGIGAGVFVILLLLYFRIKK